MKDMEKIIRFAQSQGWHVEATSRHLRFTGPDGRFVIAPSTPSDWRSYQNTLGDLRRAGLEPPRKRIKRKQHIGSGGRALEVARTAGIDLNFARYPHIEEIIGQWRHQSWFDDDGFPVDEEEWGRWSDEELVAAILLTPATGFILPSGNGAAVGLSSKALAARPSDRSLFILLCNHKFWVEPDTRSFPDTCWCGYVAPMDQVGGLAVHIVKRWERDETEHCPVHREIMPWSDPNEIRLLMGEDTPDVEGLRLELQLERDRRRASEQELAELKARVKALIG